MSGRDLQSVQEEPNRAGTTAGAMSRKSDQQRDQSSQSKFLSREISATLKRRQRQILVVKLKGLKENFSFILGFVLFSFFDTCLEN